MTKTDSIMNTHCYNKTKHHTQYDDFPSVLVAVNITIWEWVCVCLCMCVYVVWGSMGGLEKLCILIY